MTQKIVVNCNKCGAECDATRRLWSEEKGRARQAIDFCELHSSELGRYIGSPLLSISALEFELSELSKSSRELARVCEAKDEDISRKDAEISRLDGLDFELSKITRELTLASEAKDAEISRLEGLLAVAVAAPVEAEPAAAPAEPAAAPAELAELAAAPVDALQDTPPASPSA